jgi:cysteine-rich repeat protein
MSAVQCVAVLMMVLFGISTSYVHAQYAATTTVSLTVCGDALVAPTEFCDDGTNTGAYSDTIAGRNCDPLCDAWGPYCGDGNIQVYNGEECDDGNNTAGDLCDALCQNEQDPVTEGGGDSGGTAGGGGGKSSGTNKRGIKDASKTGVIEFEGHTEVTIRGIAYPGATITMLRDGEIEKVIEAGSDATFEETLVEQTPGITTFGFWALDKNGLQSITYAATFQIIENAITTLSGIFIPPTISVTPEKIPPGDPATFSGSAAPDTSVQLYTDDNENPDVTLAAGNGEWTYVFDTATLAAEAFHTTKANYVDPDNDSLKSGYSQILSYYVGNNDADSGITADLNNDGFVNLADFSILLFHWNTSSAVADINTDGTVSLGDFSVMLFYWTG